MDIDELKAKVGIGGAKLEIAIPKVQYSNDETIKGSLILAGGKVPQKIRTLNIQLVHQWNVEYYVTEMNIAGGPIAGMNPIDDISVQAQYELEEDRGNDVVSDIELAKDIGINPDEEKSFAFEIDIAKIREEPEPNEKWKLRARAGIPYAKDAVASCEIKIVKQK